MELLFILGNGNPDKISHIFSKENFSYISGGGNPEKMLYLRKQNFFIFSKVFL